METLLDAARINEQNEMNRDLVQSVRDGSFQKATRGKVTPTKAKKVGTTIHLGDVNNLPPRPALTKKLLPLVIAGALGATGIGVPLALGWLDSMSSKPEPTAIDTDTKYDMDFAEPKTVIQPKN